MQHSCVLLQGLFCGGVFEFIGDGEGVSPSGSPTQTPEETDDDDDSDGSISTFLNTLTAVVSVSLAGLFL